MPPASPKASGPGLGDLAAVVMEVEPQEAQSFQDMHGARVGMAENGLSQGLRADRFEKRNEVPADVVPGALDLLQIRLLSGQNLRGGSRRSQPQGEEGPHEDLRYPPPEAEGARLPAAADPPQDLPFDEHRMLEVLQRRPGPLPQGPPPDLGRKGRHLREEGATALLKFLEAVLELGQHGDAGPRRRDQSQVNEAPVRYSVTRVSKKFFSFARSVAWDIHGKGFWRP